jgi:dehydrogenase/reductase SDR family protein 1
VTDDQPRPLAGQVAVVTGASRGVGKGIALGLGEAGATVYVTGRSRSPGRLPGTIDATADEVTRAGGRGIAVPCDHADDADVARLFEHVLADAGRVDILVNNAFCVPDGDLFQPFWQAPLSFWDDMHRVGLRSHYVAAVHAARAMVAARRGLIVHVSSFGAKIYAVNVAYGVGKAGVDRMARDMARELAPHGVTSVALWPGVVRTERLELEAGRFPFDRATSESPLFSGRAVAALAADPQRQAKSGQSLVVAELAAEYGFTDVDGSRPASLRPAPR